MHEMDNLKKKNIPAFFGDWIWDTKDSGTDGSPDLNPQANKYIQFNFMITNQTRK